MKIYTKTGDKGEASLIHGKRVDKCSPQIELYGELDELNSLLGIVVGLMEEERNLNIEKEKLVKLQNHIFLMGSLMACHPEYWQKYKLPLWDSKLVLGLESEIDEMEKILPPLKNFILPNGGIISSYLHLSRSVTRRVERRLVHFIKSEVTQEYNNILLFLNRLSDYFFVLARFISFRLGKEEIIWMNKGI